MEALVATNNPAMVGKIRDALQRVGSDYSAMRVVTHETLANALTGNASVSLRVVFFCSATFSPEEVSQLKQVFEAAGEGVKIVGVGPALPPQRVLDIVRNGAFDYLDFESEERFRDSLAAIMNRLVTGRTAATTGKMFCVFGPAGGSGASFLAINLAAALASPKKPCALIDLHVRGGDSARLLNVAPRYSIASLAGKIDQLDARLFEQVLHDHECGVRLLASPELFGDYRAITPELVQRVVQLARIVMPTVVVDLEDMDHSEQVRVLAASDRVVLSVRPDYASLYRVKRHIDFLLRSKVSPQQLILVANRTGQPRELPVSCMEEMLGIKIEHRLPNDPTTANTAYNLGVPVVLSNPETQLAQSIRCLARRLTGEQVREQGESESAHWTSRIRRLSNEAYQALRRADVFS